MTEGAFQALGLSLQYFDPIVKGMTYLGTLGPTVTGYSHEIQARAGWYSAQVGMVGTLPDLEDWFENGLGRHIQILDQYANWVWAGFVNQISLNVGSVTETIGPLMNLCNRVSAKYTPINIDVYPPVAGSETTTIIVDDYPSQLNYGIIERIISCGKVTRTTADKIRDLYLQENATPPRSSQLSIALSNGKPASLTLDLLGYIHWLNTYVYEDFTTGFTTISDKIKLIIAACPTGIFSGDFSGIQANAFAVPYTDGVGKTALSIIKGLLNIGAASTDYLMNFGCYFGRKFIFEPIPTTVEYQHALGDAAQRIRRLPDNMVVYPWQVLPGKFLEVTDFLVSSQQSPTNLLQNERMKFIDSVRYSMPWGLDLSGGKMDTLSQVLAKITYTGGVW